MAHLHEGVRRPLRVAHLGRSQFQHEQGQDDGEDRVGEEDEAVQHPAFKRRICMFTHPKPPFPRPPYCRAAGVPQGEAFQRAAGDHTVVS